MLPNKVLTRFLGLILLACLSPSLVLAQSKLESSNYILDNVNFGTNFTLITSSNDVPPQISTEGPSVIELTSNSAIIKWVTDKRSSSTVQYGATSNYGQETGSSDLVTTHEVKVFGLIPETTYHYRVKSADAFGVASFSDDKTFTTPAEAGINTIKIFNVSYTEAFISWKTGLFTTSKIEYGKTTSYGLSKSTTSRSFLTDHTIQLTNLDPGSEYHLRIVAEDEKGSVTRSSDFLFETLANPSFSAISHKVVSENEVTISWKTNVFTSGIITYKSDKDTKDLTAGDSRITGDHSLTLKSLFGQTTYSYRITATDAQGKQITSESRTFTTPQDVTAPKIDNLKVNVTRSGEGLILTATWRTNEPAKNKVIYAPKTNAEDVTELPESSTYFTEHVVISSNLLPSTPYELKALATDSFGNATQESISFVTPSLRKSILQLILDSILKPFGWLAQLFG